MEDLTWAMERRNRDAAFWTQSRKSATHIVGVWKRRETVLLGRHCGIGAKTRVVEERQLEGRSRGGEEADDEGQSEEDGREDTVVSNRSGVALARDSKVTATTPWCPVAVRHI